MCVSLHPSLHETDRKTEVGNTNNVPESHPSPTTVVKLFITPESLIVFGNVDNTRTLIYSGLN